MDLGFRTDEALTIALAAGGGDRGRQQALWAFAERLLEQQRECDAALAAHGAGLFEPVSAVLTHCNTGALATAGIGTALGVIREAHVRGAVSDKGLAVAIGVHVPTGHEVPHVGQADGGAA